MYKKTKSIPVELFAAITSSVFGLCLVLGVILLAGFCWEYAIDFWLKYADSPKDFPLWGGILLAFIPGLGQISLIVAGLTFILSFFL